MLPTPLAVNPDAPPLPTAVNVALAKAAGRTNMRFRYFDGLDHGLGTVEYFNTGSSSTGYASIVDFMKQLKRP